MNKKKNILIRTDFVIYNTKLLFNDNTTVKIPSYVIQDVIENNKSILIKYNDVNVTTYSADEIKKNLITVESKIYNGQFRNEQITYNLVQIKINLNENKPKAISFKNNYSQNKLINK